MILSFILCLSLLKRYCLVFISGLDKYIAEAVLFSLLPTVIII